MTVTELLILIVIATLVLTVVALVKAIILTKRLNRLRNDLNLVELRIDYTKKEVKMVTNMQLKISDTMRMIAEALVELRQKGR